MFNIEILNDYLPTFSFEYDIRSYIQRQHIRFQSAFQSFQSMSRYPLQAHQVPALFVEPFIIHGFRSIHQPWSYYWNSLFHKHNETINVWSHLIGIIYVGHLMFYYSERLNFFENSHSWPFLVSLILACSMFACSALAHLLHSKSELVHMTCFLFDFIGVSLHGFGSGFLQIYYSAPEWYYQSIRSYYVIVLLLLGISACFLNCFAQYYFTRPYPPMKRFCQFLPCGLAWLYSIAPLLVRIYSSDMFLHPALLCHVAQIVIFLIGAVLFAFDIPQCFYPGQLDFFGQGHHLFHFCIYLATICQMHGVFWDYEEFMFQINQRTKPDLIFCAGSMILMIVCDLAIVFYFRKKIHSKLHQH